MAESEIPLADVIRQLREEMLTAVEAGKGHGLRFEVQDIEVELQVVATKGGSGELGGEGGVKLWVIGKAGGKVAAEYSSSQVHTVKLKLRPKLDGGDGDDDGIVMLAG
jgi:Trypsin-co-occurring domain 2